MIALESITFSYQQNPPVFQNYTWHVARGESWAILGPSGCGKTTLLYMLAGLRAPNAGKILIDDQPLTRPRPRTGLILQEYGLLPWTTVRENAALGLRVRNFYGPDGTHAPKNYRPTGDITTWLERLGLKGHEHDYPHALSGGMRQRVSIARAFAVSPEILLCDEPFSALDELTGQRLREEYTQLVRENGKTSIFITHSINEALQLGERILVFHRPAQIALEARVADSERDAIRERVLKALNPPAEKTKEKIA